MANIDELLELLNTSEAKETHQTASLQHQAYTLISTTDTNTPTSPSTLNDLLTTIIKPLFSRSHHQAITSTGRKSQFPAPNLPTTFTSDPIFAPPPPWKNPWTIPLLKHIITTHRTIVSISQRKSSIEAHFHLLVPALLHLIDDHDLTWKAHGCSCLASLCDLLVSVRSEILKRTGLADVFFDALRGCFHHLPSLTPEEESLALLTEMVPAWMGVVKARFVALEEFTSPGRNGGGEVLGAEQKKTSLSPAQVSSEIAARNASLNVLLRRSILYGISHLQVGQGAGMSTCPRLSTFFVRQIHGVMAPMGIYAAVHLQSVVPMLIDFLRDPFLTSVPELLEAAVEAVQGLVMVCWVRVRERWWSEVLRGCVEAWLNCVDDAEGLGKQAELGELRDVMKRLRVVVLLLGDVVGSDFKTAVKRLVNEEPALEALFGAGDAE